MGALIRTRPELEGACAAARAEGVLALDTEFVWMRTYRPQLGIVQLGCRKSCWALDAMCGADTQMFAELVADGSAVKILHDARQDLMHIRHYTGAVPKNVFDTQLAAAFAGFPAGIGLQKLLLEAVGVGLPKTDGLDAEAAFRGAGRLCPGRRPLSGGSPRRAVAPHGGIRHAGVA